MEADGGLQHGERLLRGDVEGGHLGRLLTLPAVFVMEVLENDLEYVCGEVRVDVRIGLGVERELAAFLAGLDLLAELGA